MGGEEHGCGSSGKETGRGEEVVGAERHGESTGIWQESVGVEGEGGRRWRDIAGAGKGSAGVGVVQGEGMEWDG